MAFEIRDDAEARLVRKQVAVLREHIARPHPAEHRLEESLDAKLAALAAYDTKKKAE